MSADDHLIKKAFKRVLYTQKQIEELRECMDPVTGPRYFIENFMWIQHPTLGKVQFKPFPYQLEMLRSFHDFQSSISMLGRQLGKSTIAGAYLLWYAMFIPDSFILIASKSGADAKEIMARVRYAYENLPDHIRAGVKSYNKQSIEFDNESKIKATTTTGNTGRGMSISLLFLDEVAFIPHNVAEEMWTSISPTLSTGGKCIITSTPNTDEDLFANLWFGANKLSDEYGNAREIGENGFRPFKATWKDNPYRNEEWANKERMKIGEERFRREHEVEFISFEETLISSIKLNQMTPKDPIRKTPAQVRWFEEIKPMNTYVVALDPAMGSGGDNSAIQVLELPSMKQVAEWKHNRTSVEGQVRILKDILMELEDAGVMELYWSLESNNLGEAALVVIRDTGEENFPGTFLHDPVKQAGAGRRRQGFVTTNRTKIEACSRLKSMVENKKLKVNSGALISEMKNFIHRGQTYEARPGTTDDLVSAMLLALRMVQFIALWDDNTGSAISSSIDSDDDEDDSTMPMPFLF